MDLQKYTDQIQGLVLTYGLNLVYALLILVIGLWLSKKIAKIVGKAMRRGDVDETLTKFVEGLTRATLTAFVIIATISQVGVETTSFVAVIGAAGLAVGLALQGSLSNFAAGVMLMIFRPIKVNQFIEAAGTMGVVDSIGIFVTVLTSPDNKVIYIPNSSLFGSTITNYSEKELRRVDMVFGIGYTDDIDKAKSAINDVLNSNEKVLKDPAPMIVVSELADSSVNFAVRPWCKGEHYWDVYFEVHEGIKKKFDELNISIPFPQTDVHLFKEN